MKGNLSATAQLDHYLTINYPHLFSAGHPSLPPTTSENSNAATGFENSTGGFSDRVSSGDGSVPKGYSESHSYRVHSNSSPLMQPLETNFDSFDKLSELCSSPRLILSDDCHDGLVESDGNESSYNSDKDSIERTTFKLKHEPKHYFSSKSTIESKVEEFLSEYRDGLESSWFRTPDQSTIFDDDSSDELDSNKYLSGNDSPDTVEAIWRRRRYQEAAKRKNNLV